MCFDVVTSGVLGTNCHYAQMRVGVFLILLGIDINPKRTSSGVRLISPEIS